MRPKLPSPWSYFSIQLKLILCAAVTLLLTAPSASAQGATAGPLPVATPSDRPTPPAASPPPKPRALTIGGKPNLSGTWVLNKDESDDARQKLADARGSSGQGGGQRPGWGGGQGGGQGGGGVWGPGGSGYPRGGGGGGGGQGQRSRGSGEAMEDLSQLTIAQTESAVNVTSETGHLLATYPASNQSQSGSSSGDSSGSGSSKNANPTVEWKDNQLVVTEQRERGGSTTRTYELSPDGSQLYVTTTLQNPRFKNPVTIRFVYDPAPSGG